MKSLKPMEVHASFLEIPKKYVVKCSNINLSVTQSQTLLLGPKFCDVSTHVNELSTKTHFESLARQTKDLIPVYNKELKKNIVDCLNISSQNQQVNYFLENKFQLLDLLRNEDIALNRTNSLNKKMLQIRLSGNQLNFSRE